jgi:crossover junction endodeoxyribonuclease RuvC
MRILGIDPGLQTTGFGVVDVDGHRLSYVASGTIRTTGLALGDLPGRLKVLFDGISEVAARYQPDALGLAVTHAHAGAAMARIAQVAPLSRRQHAMYKGGRSY